MTLTVTLERQINARPETVFGFFTDQAKWLSWMGADGQFTFEPGGAFTTNVSGDNYAAGTFLEIDPYRRVVFTWGWERGGMADVPAGSSLVTIELTPEGQGTHLRLTHSGLPSAQACAAHEEGWRHYTDRLATRAAGGDPGPDSYM
ncbi:SRPBCC domain-containing protein [Micromonospora sp. NPDC047707]|uniref:SRPBCC family protein n=1 Tax=Micromonospora sp. NPDC047707 TaxID=3154498 RepID=UPI0034521E14